eukprot:scaffold86443_cov69-Phaeocystis_antarctica.AAC.1
MPRFPKKAKGSAPPASAPVGPDAILEAVEDALERGEKKLRDREPAKAQKLFREALSQARGRLRTYILSNHPHGSVLLSSLTGSLITMHRRGIEFVLAVSVVVVIIVVPLTLVDCVKEDLLLVVCCVLVSIAISPLLRSKRYCTEHFRLFRLLTLLRTLACVERGTLTTVVEGSCRLVVTWPNGDGEGYTAPAILGET